MKPRGFEASRGHALSNASSARCSSFPSSVSPLQGQAAPECVPLLQCRRSACRFKSAGNAGRRQKTGLALERTKTPRAQGYTFTCFKRGQNEHIIQRPKYEFIQLYSIIRSFEFTPLLQLNCVGLMQKDAVSLTCD